MAKITTIFSMIDNVTNPLKRMRGELDKTSGGLSNMAMKMIGINQAIQLVSTAVNGFKKVCAVMDELTATYNIQAEQEIKLATVMKQRMNATEADIQVIKDLASAQQELGIYGDELILNGSQEIATFVSSRKALETLVPAMNDLIAQQKGYNASIQDFQSVGDMMGKVMGGQVSALSRIGYVFSDAEKQMLQYGSEEERASVLAKIITDNVGHMNQALAGTDVGTIQNATNALGDMYERLGESLISLQGAFKQIKTSVMLYFEKPLLEAINWIKNNIDSLVATIIYLGTVVTVVATAMAVAWAIANWPITLAIILIVSLIRVIYSIVESANEASESINGMANQCSQAGRVLGGVVGFIGSTVLYVMNMINNVIAYVYNAFVKWIELIINMRHPIQALEGFFLNMVSTILEGIQAIATPFSFIFGKKLTDSINKMNEAVKRYKKENVSNKEGYITLGRAQLKQNVSIWEGTMAGMKTGADLGNILDEKFSSIKFKPDESMKNMFPQQDFKTDSSGALLVSDVNMVDIADDYRELLSKRATERFNLQFSQVTPKVNFGGITVNENADAGIVLSALVAGVEQAQSSSLRG